MHYRPWNDLTRAPLRDGEPVVRTSLDGSTLPLSARSAPQIIRALAAFLAKRHLLETNELLSSRRGACPQLRAMVYQVAIGMLGMAESKVRRLMSSGNDLDRPERVHRARMADAASVWYRSEYAALVAYVEANI